MQMPCHKRMRQMEEQLEACDKCYQAYQNRLDKGRTRSEHIQMMICMPAACTTNSSQPISNRQFVQMAHTEAHLLHLLSENHGEAIGLGPVMRQGGLTGSTVDCFHELIAEHLHALNALHGHRGDSDPCLLLQSTEKLVERSSCDCTSGAKTETCKLWVGGQEMPMVA